MVAINDEWYPLFCRFFNWEKAIIFFMMNTLQDIVHRIYGKRLIQRATQGHAHFLFTTFDDEITQETYFLKVVELPTYLYIS